MSYHLRFYEINCEFLARAKKISMRRLEISWLMRIQVYSSTEGYLDEDTREISHGPTMDGVLL